MNNFDVLPEYKLVKFGVHFAGIEAGRQFREIWPILVTLTGGGLVLGIPRYEHTVGFILYLGSNSVDEANPAHADSTH